MEKGKKEVKKEIKKTSVKEEKVVFNPEIKKAVKIVTLFISFFAVIMCIFTFVFGIITALKVANSTKVELLQNNFSVTFLSNINAKSIVEMKDLIQGYGGKTLFIIFNVIIPALAIIAVSTLTIILLKKIFDFVNDVDTEKELYTKNNLNLVEKLACLATAIITITFVIFDKPSIALYCFNTALLFIIIALFKKCVKEK